MTTRPFQTLRLDLSKAHQDTMWTDEVTEDNDKTPEYPLREDHPLAICNRKRLELWKGSQGSLPNSTHEIHQQYHSHHKVSVELGACAKHPISKFETKTTTGQLINQHSDNSTNPDLSFNTSGSYSKLFKGSKMCRDRNLTLQTQNLHHNLQQNFETKQIGDEIKDCSRLVNGCVDLPPFHTRNGTRKRLKLSNHSENITRPKRTVHCTDDNNNPDQSMVSLASINSHLSNSISNQQARSRSISNLIMEHYNVNPGGDVFFEGSHQSHLGVDYPHNDNDNSPPHLSPMPPSTSNCEIHIETLQEQPLPPILLPVSNDKQFLHKRHLDLKSHSEYFDFKRPYLDTHAVFKHVLSVSSSKNEYSNNLHFQADTPEMIQKLELSTHKAGEEHHVKHDVKSNNEDSYKLSLIKEVSAVSSSKLYPETLCIVTTSAGDIESNSTSWQGIENTFRTTMTNSDSTLPLPELESQSEMHKKNVATENTKTHQPQVSLSTTLTVVGKENVSLCYPYSNAQSINDNPIRGGKVTTISSDEVLLSNELFSSITSSTTSPNAPTLRDKPLTTLYYTDCVNTVSVLSPIPPTIIHSPTSFKPQTINSLSTLPRCSTSLSRHQGTTHHSKFSTSESSTSSSETAKNSPDNNSVSDELPLAQLESQSSSKIVSNTSSTTPSSETSVLSPSFPRFDCTTAYLITQSQASYSVSSSDAIRLENASPFLDNIQTFCDHQKPTSCTVISSPSNIIAADGTTNFPDMSFPVVAVTKFESDEKSDLKDTTLPFSSISPQIPSYETTPQPSVIVDQDIKIDDSLVTTSLVSISISQSSASSISENIQIKVQCLPSEDTMNGKYHPISCETKHEVSSIERPQTHNLSPPPPHEDNELISFLSTYNNRNVDKINSELHQNSHKSPFNTSTMESGLSEIENYFELGDHPAHSVKVGTTDCENVVKCESPTFINERTVLTVDDNGDAVSDDGDRHSVHSFDGHDKTPRLPLKDFFTTSPDNQSYSSLALATLQHKIKKDALSKRKSCDMEEDVFNFLMKGKPSDQSTPSSLPEPSFINADLQNGEVIDLTLDGSSEDVLSISSNDQEEVMIWDDAHASKDTEQEYSATSEKYEVTARQKCDPLQVDTLPVDLSCFKGNREERYECTTDNTLGSRDSPVIDGKAYAVSLAEHIKKRTLMMSQERKTKLSAKIQSIIVEKYSQLPESLRSSVKLDGYLENASLEMNKNNASPIILKHEDGSTNIHDQPSENTSPEDFTKERADSNEHSTINFNVNDDYVTVVRHLPCSNDSFATVVSDDQCSAKLAHNSSEPLQKSVGLTDDNLSNIRPSSNSLANVTNVSGTCPTISDQSHKIQVPSNIISRHVSVSVCDLNNLDNCGSLNLCNKSNTGQYKTVWQSNFDLHSGSSHFDTLFRSPVQLTQSQPCSPHNRSPESNENRKLIKTLELLHAAKVISPEFTRTRTTFELPKTTTTTEHLPVQHPNISEMSNTVLMHNPSARIMTTMQHPAKMAMLEPSEVQHGNRTKTPEYMLQQHPKMNPCPGSSIARLQYTKARTIPENVVIRRPVATRAPTYNIMLQQYPKTSTIPEPSAMQNLNTNTGHERVLLPHFSNRNIRLEAVTTPALVSNKKPDNIYEHLNVRGIPGPSLIPNPNCRNIPEQNGFLQYPNTATRSHHVSHRQPHTVNMDVAPVISQQHANTNNTTPAHSIAQKLHTMKMSQSFTTEMRPNEHSAFLESTCDTFSEPVNLSLSSPLTDQKSTMKPKDVLAKHISINNDNLLILSSNSCSSNFHHEKLVRNYKELHNKESNKRTAVTSSSAHTFKPIKTQKTFSPFQSFTQANPTSSETRQIASSLSNIAQQKFLARSSNAGTLNDLETLVTNKMTHNIQPIMSQATITPYHSFTSENYSSTERQTISSFSNTVQQHNVIYERRPPSEMEAINTRKHTIANYVPSPYDSKADSQVFTSNLESTDHEYFHPKQHAAMRDIIVNTRTSMAGVSPPFPFHGSITQGTSPQCPRPIVPNTIMPTVISNRSYSHPPRTDNREIKRQENLGNVLMHPPPDQIKNHLFQNGKMQNRVRMPTHRRLPDPIQHDTSRESRYPTPPCNFPVPPPRIPFVTFKEPGPGNGFFLAPVPVVTRNNQNPNTVLNLMSVRAPRPLIVQKSSKINPILLDVNRKSLDVNRKSLDVNHKLLEFNYKLSKINHKSSGGTTTTKPSLPSVIHTTNAYSPTQLPLGYPIMFPVVPAQHLPLRPKIAPIILQASQTSQPVTSLPMPKSIEIENRHDENRSLDTNCQTPGRRTSNDRNDLLPLVYVAPSTLHDSIQERQDKRGQAIINCRIISPSTPIPDLEIDHKGMPSEIQCYCNPTVSPGSSPGRKQPRTIIELDTVMTSGDEIRVTGTNGRKRKSTLNGPGVKHQKKDDEPTATCIGNGIVHEPATHAGSGSNINNIVTVPESSPGLIQTRSDSGFSDSGIALEQLPEYLEGRDYSAIHDYEENGIVLVSLEPVQNNESTGGGITVSPDSLLEQFESGVREINIPIKDTRNLKDTDNKIKIRNKCYSKGLSSLILASQAIERAEMNSPFEPQNNNANTAETESFHSDRDFAQKVYSPISPQPLCIITSQNPEDIHSTGNRTHRILDDYILSKTGPSVDKNQVTEDERQVATLLASLLQTAKANKT